MKELSFEFLNEYASQNAEVTIRLDPSYNRDQTERKVLGKIWNDQGMMRILFGTDLHTPKHEAGKFVPIIDAGQYCGSYWSTCPNLGGAQMPYLGTTNTVWSITLLNSREELFGHQELGIDYYRIVGPKDSTLGQLVGVPSRYHTPYDPWKSVERTTAGKSEDAMKEFFEWRDRVLQL